MSPLCACIQTKTPISRLDRGGRFANFALDWLSNLHFGRFGWFIQTLWVFFGLVPAILAFTGVFICCRRVIFQKP